MNIHLYIGMRGGSFGGAENTIVTLVDALKLRHSVQIITHDPEMTLETFSRSAGLENVTMRFVPESKPMPTKIRPGRRKLVEQWNADVSRGADLFLNFANRTPPFSHARCGMIRVFFPFEIPPYKKQGTGFRGAVRSFFLKQEWDAKWRTYDALVANSAYTASWIKRRWGLTASVVHPPVDTDFPAGKKEPLITSVGRFALYGNAKKQLELMQAFSKLSDLRADGWKYASIGGAGTGEGDAAFMESVRAVTPEGGRMMVDLPRAEMKDMLSGSRIFWHAAGWGEDPEAHPERFEHFGQSTVEAMAAGAVPVVINAGGQTEIVEHGVSGFLWNTEDELLEFTRLLAQDSGLCAEMSQAATKRAAVFSKAVFTEQFVKLIDEHSALKGVGG